MIKLFLYPILLITLISCSGGGGGAKGGGSPNPTPIDPTNITLTINIPEDGSKNISLISVNQNAYTYNLTSTPLKGTISGTAPNLTYTSNPNASGFDSFSYQLISNSSNITNKTVTVHINISGVNDRPIANNLEFYVQKGNSLIFNLTGSDPDGDNLSYRVSIPPSRGFLSQVNGARFGYDADNEIYDVSFSYVVSDGSIDSLPATVTLHVTKVNQAPILNSPTSYSMLEDVQNFAINLSVTDPNNDSMTAQVTQAPTKGSLNGSFPNYTYTPNLNYNGSDSFKIKIHDGFGGFLEPIFNLTITSVNDVPVANNVTTTVNSNAFFKQIILTGTDPDTDQTLSYAIVSYPTKGYVDINANGIATYTPADDNQSGTDVFTYRISDGISFSNTATVTLLYNTVINPPVAYNDNIAATENTNATITVQGYSLDNNLTYEIIEHPSKGTLSGSGPNFTYKSNLGATGDDFFSFKIKDSQNQESNIAGIVITINEAPIQYNGFIISGTEVEEKFLKNFSQSISNNLYLNLENNVETNFSWLSRIPNVCLSTNNNQWELFQVGLVDQETDPQNKVFNFQSDTWTCDSKNKMSTNGKTIYSDGEILVLSELSTNQTPQIWVGYNSSSSNFQADLSTISGLIFNKVFSTNYSYVYESNDTEWLIEENINGNPTIFPFMKLLNYSMRTNPNDPESQVELYSRIIDNGSNFSLFGLFRNENNEMIQVTSYTNTCEIDDLECVEETINLNKTIGFGFNNSSKLLLSLHYFVGEIPTDATAGELTPDPNKDNIIRAEASKQIIIYEQQ